MLSAVAGGATGSAASVGGAVDEFGGTRISRSEFEARANDNNEPLKETIRL